MFLQFWHLRNTQRRFFWVVNALWVCWKFLGVLSFWFWSLCFWNMSFFVFVLDAIFCGTNFFMFQDTVWLAKFSRCVHYCTIPQFYWVSDHCRSGFALWWLFFRKKVVVTNWLFQLASGPGYWLFLQFWQTKNTATLFLVFKCAVGLLTVHGSTKFLNLFFMFLKYVFFCVYSWCDLLWYNFFRFSGHCVAS